MPAVMSRYAAIVCHKSLPGGVHVMGRYLTASLSPLIIAANQANRRNTNKGSNRSPDPPRHLSSFSKPLRISAFQQRKVRNHDCRYI